MDNCNHVHFSGGRFICSHYLAIRSSLAFLRQITTICVPQIKSMPAKCTFHCQPFSLPQRQLISRVLEHCRYDSCFNYFAGLCLGCGDTKVAAEHPLFEGGLCKECKVNISNSAYSLKKRLKGFSSMFQIG